MVDDDAGASTERKPALRSLLNWIRGVALFALLSFLASMLAVLAVHIDSNDRNSQNARLIAQVQQQQAQLQQQQQDIIATRTQSRTATCQIFARMLTAHDNLTGHVIGEQQEINGSREVPFLERWVATFQTDVLPVPNCNDPAQVAALFTPTTGG